MSFRFQNHKKIVFWKIIKKIFQNLNLCCNDVTPQTNIFAICAVFINFMHAFSITRASNRDSREGGDTWLFITLVSKVL